MNERAPIVYVVDDDEAVRDSLRMLLKSVGHEVRTFASAKEFLAGHDTSRPGCIVLDIRMPEMSGLELQEALRRQRFRLPVIFITGHGDVPMAVQAMQRGAADFIQKPFRDQDLLDVIHRALDGSVAERGVQAQRGEVLKRLGSLTAREREVMDMVVAGHANKVIAIELGISQRTVEIHRARVMEKMQCRSLADLVRLALLAED